MEPDRIYIRDLLLRCIIGFNDDERREKQDVLINIILEADLAAPCLSDRIADSVDYRAVKKRVISLVEGSDFLLLERLVGAVADACLEDSKVDCVRVTVDKPGALRFARSVAVELVRRRAR